MPRADDPTARSIFDLLEEKYPRETGPEPPAARAPRRAVAATPSGEAIDGGSRSLLLASLVVLLATALVTLSLKPDLPSTMGDTAPAVVADADAQPTSEIGIRSPATAPAPQDRLRIGVADSPPRRPAPEPAAVATLTVAEPAAEPDVRQAQVPTPSPAPDAPVPVRPALARPVRAEPAPVKPVPVKPVPPEPAPARPTEIGPETLADGGSHETMTAPDREPARFWQPRAATAEIDPPVRLVTPLPTYTQDAWVAGIQGDVLVRARIDKEGTVADVKVLRGLPHGLTEAAVAAVRRWRFRPASIDGEPVSADHDLSIRFTL